MRVWVVPSLFETRANQPARDEMEMNMLVALMVGNMKEMMLMMVKKENDNEMEVFAPQDPGAREVATFPWCVGGGGGRRWTELPYSPFVPLQDEETTCKEP